jgi:phospholipid/cholesterol/gamma-HCH transport system permease protein
MSTTNIATQYDAELRQLNCNGPWDLAHLPGLESLLDQIAITKSGDICIEGRGVTTMDTAGAWLLNSWMNKLRHGGNNVTLKDFADAHAELIQLIAARMQEEKQNQTALPSANLITRFGQNTVASLNGFFEYLSFVGLLSLEALRVLARPQRLRWKSLASVIYRTGYSAIPIIALLSFMIGVVITYQMGLQLKNYGANIFIVDLLGLAILREFGPLLTAIMVAGRSGSAFTAQLGMMKLNQEIDALDTMGVTPSELLLLPRIAGLVITLPLLTVWADIMGVFGGMVMSSNMLSITWYDFMHRFPNVIPLRALFIGVGKAPVFALIIASVGCFQGVKVSGSADSVGVNTTRSVVLSIFFIILADAAFSIIFSELKL